MSFSKAMLRYLGIYDMVRWVYRKAKYEKYVIPYRLSARFSGKVGTTSQKRSQELIISLTSFSARIPTIHLCLDSLLRQSIKPDRVILWLNEKDKSGNKRLSQNDLPKSLTRLQKRGLEIRWCENIGSYCKLIPTMREHPDSLIVTADDDQFYPANWLEQLYNAYLKEPEYVHCHIAHRIMYSPDGKPMPYLQWDLKALGYQGPAMDIFPTGVGGVIYAPNHLHPEVLNEETFLSICPKADDVWFKAMSLLNKVACKKIIPGSLAVKAVQIQNNKTLCDDNLQGGENDSQINAVALKYGVFYSTSN